MKYSTGWTKIFVGVAKGLVRWLKCCESTRNADENRVKPLGEKVLRSAVCPMAKGVNQASSTWGLRVLFDSFRRRTRRSTKRRSAKERYKVNNEKLKIMIVKRVEGVIAWTRKQG